MPGPRINRPVCWPSTSRGGSHLVMIMVSRTPTCRPPGRGRPVRAASLPCSRCAGPPTVRTSVAIIHSPCFSQSVRTAHTRSGVASTSIRSVSSGMRRPSLVGAPRSVGGDGVRAVLRPRPRRRMRRPLPQDRDLGVPLVEDEGELFEQPVDLAHAVAPEGHRDPQGPNVVGGDGTVVGQLDRRPVELGRWLRLPPPQQYRRPDEHQRAHDQDPDDEQEEAEHQASSGPWCTCTCCMPPPPSPARRALSAAWITDMTSPMSSVTVIRSRSAALMVPVWASVERIQASRPAQYSVPNRITGKRVTFRVCTSVSASNSSSRVPNPPGRMTNACAYFTNIVLRTKK